MSTNGNFAAMNCVGEGDAQISRLMNPAIESELRALSPAERILLVEEIWDRIAADPETVPVSAAHRAELDRRLDSLEKNPDPGRPWAEVRDELRRR